MPAGGLGRALVAPSTVRIEVGATEREGQMVEDQRTADIRLLLTEVVDELGPVAVMTALRDEDDTIVDFRYD
jgi:hypothetical protein